MGHEGYKLAAKAHGSISLPMSLKLCPAQQP